MTPKGFSGVTCRSMSVVVVTALVLMDTVATDVGEDDCFWSDKTIKYFRVSRNIDENLLKNCWIMKYSKTKIGCIPPSSHWLQLAMFFLLKQLTHDCWSFIQRYLRKIVEQFLFCDQELAQNSLYHFPQKIHPPTLPFSSWTCGWGSI